MPEEIYQNLFWYMFGVGGGWADTNFCLFVFKIHGSFQC